MFCPFWPYVWGQEWTGERNLNAYLMDLERLYDKEMVL